MYRSAIFLKISLFFILLILPGTVACYAQSYKIDSLSLLLKSHPKQDDKRAELLLLLATEGMKFDPKQGLPHADEVLSFQNAIKNKNYVASAHRTKAGIFLYLSRFPESLESYNRAITVDKILKNEVGIGAALGNIGIVYMTQGKFPEALKYFLQALKKQEELKNELYVGIMLTNAGIVYTEMGDYKEAMSHYQRALSVFKKYKHFVGQANTLGNIGIVHSKMNNLDEAIKYSKLAIQIGDSIGNTRISARENGNLSGYYSKQRQPDQALKYGSIAIQKNEKINNIKSLGFNYQNFSDAYYQKKNYALSKSYALNALKIGQEVNVTDLKRDASLGLSEVYTALNMPDSAFRYYKMYKEYGDSISNDQKKNEITRMGMQYEFDKTEAVYREKQILAEGQLKQQQLQLALNRAELQRGLQQTALQKALLENEKLVSEEKQKQLIISQNNEKLQSNKLNLLSQQQRFDQLEIRQLWLYGILAIVSLLTVLIYLLNLSRIRKLKFASTLQLREAEQNNLKLEHQYQLSESELRAIRSQMNPHFIFNVLNSIESYIMDNDKRTASRLVQKFASLSRLILENSIKSLIPADKEWKALRLYTELEAMRYNNSFTYSFEHAPEISLSTILLPPMLIQPLIENAILHGIIGQAITDAHISVTMVQSEQTLIIKVSDNGIGLNRTSNKTLVNVVKEKSIGLKSIRERIKLLNLQYPGSASFSVDEGPEQRGTIAVISLPVLGVGSGEI
ncbi:tetratricopeptide repeat protein [Dyadobacter sp. CY312]|uniref:tetratricopeptide repeat-containing sensor histidine kinase n=1 Tax=Dyadobacter sp. CY312 TaxID=2907303 RepID=UPI001F29C5E2|nr:tetratricopeptide repeat protein [Dyadobacter sp. CY312]MCE7042532.1 tetratricopeptide repeat protein [Dyadobacter sp. CY312]